MLCDKCGKNHATTHIKRMVNGFVKEYNLCSVCAAKEGYSSNSLSGMLASMFGEISNIDLSNDKTVKCLVCGSTFSDIAKTGKAGCSECYTTFYDDLLPYLKRVHGKIEHSGKVPENVCFKEKKTLQQLKEELNRLVSEEKYEQAAIIRDKIKEAEGKMNG